jgi:hypothetical protein
MFSILSRKPELRNPAPRRSRRDRFDNVSFAYEPARPILKGGFSLPAPEIDHLAASVPFLTSPAGILIDSPGYSRGFAEIAAPPSAWFRDRAVQRHDPLQHPLRPLGCDRHRVEAAGMAQIDSFIRLAPKG